MENFEKMLNAFIYFSADDLAPEDVPVLPVEKDEYDIIYAMMQSEHRDAVKEEAEFRAARVRVVDRARKRRRNMKKEKRFCK